MPLSATLRPCHPKTVVSPLGVFSRARRGASPLGFFFFCPFSFFCSSRVRSFSSRCWFGVVSWLLFLAASFFFPFLLWFGGLVRFCFSFSCCCFRLRCLSFGRCCGVGASWLVFCLWLCLVRLCACRALAVFVGGSSPFFLAIAVLLQSNFGIKRSRARYYFKYLLNKLILRNLYQVELLFFQILQSTGFSWSDDLSSKYLMNFLLSDSIGSQIFFSLLNSPM